MSSQNFAVLHKPTKLQTKSGALCETGTEMVAGGFRLYVGDRAYLNVEFLSNTIKEPFAPTPPSLQLGACGQVHCPLPRDESFDMRSPSGELLRLRPVSGDCDAYADE